MVTVKHIDPESDLNLIKEKKEFNLQLGKLLISNVFLIALDKNN
ncbi:hypothetical protein [Clostridium botulinum]